MHRIVRERKNNKIRKRVNLEKKIEMLRCKKKSSGSAMQQTMKTADIPKQQVVEERSKSKVTLKTELKTNILLVLMATDRRLVQYYSG